ncbi:hypothetical protein NPIL_227721 [Nephila pilipes]|uniref:Uncharacterized protein n=1 Tax=Nephila pilipes TaxID=299642 RepID=A0A8X6M7K4_NEPPI|nr:hypothetical protein NPIL_227721 [Nephila pilipes]
MDFAGPFLITPRRGRGVKAIKMHVCVFVCFTTIAIYLELVSATLADLSKTLPGLKSLDSGSVLVLSSLCWPSSLFPIFFSFSEVPGGLRPDFPWAVLVSHVTAPYSNGCHTLLRFFFFLGRGFLVNNYRKDTSVSRELEGENPRVLQRFGQLSDP